MRRNLYMSIKKTFIYLILFFGVQQQSRSQVIISLIFGEKLNSPRVEFGLDGGLTLSQMTGIRTSNRLNTFNLGFYFDFKFKNPHWMINTGVLVKSLVGAEGLEVYNLKNETLNQAFKEGKVNRKLSYFYVPVSVKHQFHSNFFIKAGIQLGLMHKAYDEFITTIDEDEDLHYSNNIQNQYKTLDAGLLAGIGYRLMGGNGMNLSINYYEGSINVMKEGLGYFVRNRAMYFNVGIPIGAAKKKEKINETPDS